LDSTTHFQVRSARDRLIDLLGIGDTYPLADLHVRGDQLKVAFGNTAKIPIEDAQAWVIYELHDSQNRAVKRDGADCQISLLFLVSDFRDFSALAQKLIAHSDSLSEYVWGLFSFDVKLVLENSSSTPQQRLDALVLGFNTIISGISIYDDLLKKGVTPSDEARELASKKPRGAQLVLLNRLILEVLLNRLILEDGYPKELIIRRSPPRFETKGNGVTLLLETPEVREDITYCVFARKYRSDKGVRLQQRAPVKVGLDTSLSAEILQAPLLDPAVDSRPPTEPRIVHHGASVEVKIQKSQEGVDYRLVYFKPGQPGEEEKLPERAAVRGDLHDIVLSTGPIDEDIDIRIRATKTFDPSEQREPSTADLDVVLPLKVRARRTLQVEPSPVIGYKEDASVKIAGTQKSAKYRLYFRVIPDRDFVHRSDTGLEVIKVSAQGGVDVQIRKPVQTDVWQEPEGYKPLGDPQPGNDGELKLTLKALTDDALVIIQALKEHQTGKADPGPKVIRSAVQLDQTVAILVGPNPAPELTLRVPVESSWTGNSVEPWPGRQLRVRKTGGTIQVLNGQPGVFYFFRQTLQGPEFPLPAYIHQRDDHDASLNKGLGQLTLEIDFVIAADPAGTGDSVSANRAQVAPEPPLLDTGPLNAASTLYVRAVKAQTQIATPLVDAAQIGLVPEIQATVDPGSTARILVIASKQDEKYQVMLKGKPVKRALHGNGKDLVFITDTLLEDTTFEVVVTRPADKGIIVERLVQVPVQVKPK
jgi:hypothetical protein